MTLASLATGLKQLERRSEHDFRALPWHGALLLGLLIPFYLLAIHAPAAGSWRLDLLDSAAGRSQFVFLWLAGTLVGTIGTLVLRASLVGAMSGLCGANLATGMFDDHLLMLIPTRLPGDRWPDPAGIYKRLTELQRDYDEICWRRGLRIYPPVHEFVILRGRYLLLALLLLVLAGATAGAMYGGLWFVLYVAVCALLVVALPLTLLVQRSISIGMSRAFVSHTRRLHAGQPLLLPELTESEDA